jgi:hypothetical protein
LKDFTTEVTKVQGCAAIIFDYIERMSVWVFCTLKDS